LTLVSPYAFSQTAKVEIRTDFRKYFDAQKVDGCVVVYDLKNDRTALYNPKECNRGTVPASTFKICNSLIGLETGVLTDENHLIKWDGVKRRVDEWNQDQTLATAFQRSAFWYYQEVARRVGGQRMYDWLQKADYGNKDTTGGIGQFWLEGGLRITPVQQIDFLKRLYLNKLPFSQRSMDIVKKIMLAKQDKSYTLYAKTGWGFEGTAMVGWYVGYVETQSPNVYFFATRITSPDREHPTFGEARKKITYEVLRGLKIVDIAI